MDMLQGTRDYFAPATSLFDLLQPLPLPCDGEKDEFMDMLQGTRDYFAPATSLFDLLQPLPLSPHQPLLSPASTVPESSEVVNTPATPNSSSISSSSTEAANDDQQQSKTPDEQAEQDPQEKTKKTLHLALSLVRKGYSWLSHQVRMVSKYLGMLKVSSGSLH